MKKYSAFWWTLLAFGLINGYDAISRFGWLVVDQSQAKLFMINLWTATRNIVGYTLIITSIVFVLGRKSKWVLVPMFAVILGIEAASEYSARVFHAAIDDNWIALVTNTSFDEIKNFVEMSITGPFVAALLLYVLIVLGYAVVMWRAAYPSGAWKYKLVGVGLVCPFLITNVLTMNWHAGVGQTIWSGFIVSSYTSWKYMQGIVRACDHPVLPAEMKTLVSKDELPNVIIVIGESSTRNNWGLYGYPRQTTPRMCALCRDGGNGVAMRDLVGIQPITVGAVSILFTDSVFGDSQRGSWTLAEVYRRAGYYCVQISNQLNGENDKSLLARLYNGCEKRINPRGRLSKEKKYDEYMLPFIKEELACRDEKPIALFVHLSGMHFPVHDVNPPADNYFNDDVEADVLIGLSEHDRDRRNRYDNGVRYEDKVLGMIVDAAKETKRPTVMFYVTDHGESPRSSEWRNFEDVDVYELPCVMWFSDEYVSSFSDVVKKVKAAADRPLQPDQLTTGLVEIGMIRCEESFDKCFFDEEFKGRSPRFIDKGRIVYQPRR